MSFKNSYYYYYRAFGLNIASEINIPEFLTWDDCTDEIRRKQPDVFIHWGDVPESLAYPKLKGVRFQVKPDEFLLTVDNIARYHVLQGNRIIITPHPDTDERDIRVFLLGSAFGAIFHQRGVLPLHGSAIKVKNSCVVFCGTSGKGKSTTAGAFIKRGYSLHTDDVCVISLNHDENEKRPIVFPAFPQIKLWEDALKKAGDDCSRYPQIRKMIAKYAVPVPRSFNTKPLPLKKIYILNPYEKEVIHIEPITGMNKLYALKNHTYRFRYLKGLDKEVTHFNHAGILANCVPISRVQRPRDSYKLTELINALESDFLSLKDK